MAKGPVKRVKIAHSFLVCVRSVPRYHYKLAYVILQMAVKEVFITHFQKWRNRSFKSVFTKRVILADLEMTLIHSI